MKDIIITVRFQRFFSYREVTKMKRILILALVTISICFTNVYPIHAHEMNNENIYNDVIRNGKESSNSTATLISSEGKEYTLKVYESNEMPDKGKKHATYDNESQKMYKDFAVDIQAISQITDEEWDTTGGVKAWGRVYYDKNGRNVLVTRMEGNWRNEDGYPTVLKNQQAFVYCIGMSSDGTIQQTQQITRDVYGSFDFNTGFKKYVNLNESISYAGGATKVTIERNGKTWQLNLDLAIY